MLLIRYSWAECFPGTEEQMQSKHYLLKCPFVQKKPAGRERVTGVVVLDEVVGEEGAWRVGGEWGGRAERRHGGS